MSYFSRPLLITSLALSTVFGLSLTSCNKVPSSDPAPAQQSTEFTLSSVIANPHRSDDAKRDQYRHPKETLEFFDLKPGQSVAEIWPGWYAKILAPYLAGTDGTYTAVLYDPAMGERAQKRTAAFKLAYADTDNYGDIQYGALGPETTEMMPPNSADLILTFRNVHNWMGGDYADKAFAQFYAALKPGGILGVVEHRLPESATQDPTGGTGYVQESYIKALAKEAGFEFVISSEINANPKDDANHPFGVWTLPPRSRTPKEGSDEVKDFDAQYYKDIGESDRATLKFKKPG